MGKQLPGKSADIKLWAGVIAVLAAVVIIFVCRDHIAPLAGYGAMKAKGGEISSGARFFRDFMVLVVAVIGVSLAFWRTKTGDERLLRDRFATAAELMAKGFAGNAAIAARINGIYIMADLAMENPALFAEQVVKGLIAYVKDNARKTASPPLGEKMPDGGASKLGEDVKAAITALDQILRSDKVPEMPDGILDFSRQDFSCLDFSDTDLDMKLYKKWGATIFTRAFLQEKQIAYDRLQPYQLLGAVIISHGTPEHGTAVEKPGRAEREGISSEAP